MKALGKLRWCSVVKSWIGGGGGGGVGAATAGDDCVVHLGGPAETTMLRSRNGTPIAVTNDILLFSMKFTLSRKGLGLQFEI